MTDEPVRVRILVSGRVQGVFFRAEARQRARELGLSGWARNLPDGRVEIAVEGPESSVQEIIRWCHQGPRMASVEEIEVSKEEPAGDSGFTIR